MRYVCDDLRGLLPLKNCAFVAEYIFAYKKQIKMIVQKNKVKMRYVCDDLRGLLPLKKCAFVAEYICIYQKTDKDKSTKNKI